MGVCFGVWRSNDAFPDLEAGTLPERSYLLTILSTKKPDEIKFLIQEAKSKRAVINSDDKDDLICVLPAIKDEILSVLPQKSKFSKSEILQYSYLGKAYQLLKNGAKLRKNRGVPKKYTANLEILLREPYDGDDHSKNNKNTEEEKEL